MRPHLKQGPFGGLALVGVVWAVFPLNRFWKFRFMGARVLADISIGTGWFLMLGGAFDELYWKFWVGRGP